MVAHRLVVGATGFVYGVSSAAAVADTMVAPERLDWPRGIAINLNIVFPALPMAIPSAGAYVIGAGLDNFLPTVDPVSGV